MSWRPLSETPPSGHRPPWLGLDVGTRRIGVALSNALGMASPLLTIERGQPRADLRSLLRLARRHGCAGIVVGNPLRLTGEASTQTLRVHRFVESLQALIAESAEPDLTVRLWDERLSTAEAHSALAAAGHDPNSRQARLRQVDQTAAAIILQGWLDAQSGAVTLLPEP